MAEEDEIDILGDFSFNSCFAQNNQGIPSCSDREDTVHPQWLLDSVSTNWYDSQSKDSARTKDGPSRRLTGNKLKVQFNEEGNTIWSQNERDLLAREMAKYGRNIKKLSQIIKTKTEAEIQALIEAEFGVFLETPSFGLEKGEDDDTPAAIQEEIVTDEISNVLEIMETGKPTVTTTKKPFRRKPQNMKSKHSLLKPDVLLDSKKSGLSINPSEILYEDEMVIGLTESVGSDMDSVDVLSQKMAKQQKEKVKAMKKIGNHRRKVSRNYDRGKRSNLLMKSPPSRQRKDSSVSDDSVRSPKMQIVLGSGQALPLSEGEQVIKIEKKKDSDPDSDIEIDVDSDNEEKVYRKKDEAPPKTEPTAAPVRKLQPVPRRQKKINLSGDGGYTIMHTPAGDLYEVGAEPRRERTRRPVAEPLVQCRLYNSERPAPYAVHLSVSCLISMDVHAHTSRGEVMGLVGGVAEGGIVALTTYRGARAAAAATHCDMDPVSQAQASEQLSSQGLVVVAWHHSHPHFPPAPSATDLRSQRALQAALERGSPLLGVITSPHWPTGRRATQYRCIRVEDTESHSDGTPIGYQFSVKVQPDLTADNLPAFIQQLSEMWAACDRNELSVDVVKDVCPQAGMTYLEKCISSITHHMRSAGYEDGDPIIEPLIRGVRDVFR